MGPALAGTPPVGFLPADPSPPGQYRFLPGDRAQAPTSRRYASRVYRTVTPPSPVYVVPQPQVVVPDYYDYYDIPSVVVPRQPRQYVVEIPGLPG